MDEQPDDTSEQEQERVRRLLAAASPPSEATMPDDVTARLDDVLASLGAERAAGAPESEGAESSPDPVGGAPAEPIGVGAVTGATELSSRRRPRWPRLLVAAAAVSVVGLGIGNLVGDLSGVSGGGESASTADSAGEAVRPGSQAEKSLTGREPGAPLTRLHTASIRVDVQRVEDRSLAERVSDNPEGWSEACVHPATAPHDEWLRVRLDGAAAVLVLRAPEGGRRTADVFTCDDGTSPAVSTTVAAR
ncbi:MAG TPA: hypothetical protein VK204_03835 [Nocardioidaceae bacterium]|nr:hypothetical protein [Nocardioidaceae bacterium]